MVYIVAALGVAIGSLIDPIAALVYGLTGYFSPSWRAALLRGVGVGAALLAFHILIAPNYLSYPPIYDLVGYFLGGLLGTLLVFGVVRLYRTSRKQEPISDP